MDFIKEHFSFEEGIPFALYETNARQAMIHSHDCLEINLIRNGRGHYLIENHTYPINANDIFIINNLEHHMAVHDGDLSMLVLVFAPDFVWSSPEEYEFLNPFFKRGNDFSNTVDSTYPGYQKMKEALEIIEKEYAERKDGWQLMIKAHLLLFLAELNRYYQSIQQIGIDNSPAKGYDRLRPVIAYIHKNFQKDLTLTELAEQAAMGKSYFSTYFTNTMKMRVFDYIEQVRINHSAMLLTTTTKSILEIALESGFHSSSYFNRKFKNVMKATPSEYRKSKDSTIY